MGPGHPVGPGPVSSGGGSGGGAAGAGSGGTAGTPAAGGCSEGGCGPDDTVPALLSMGGQPRQPLRPHRAPPRRRRSILLLRPAVRLSRTPRPCPGPSPAGPLGPAGPPAPRPRRSRSSTIRCPASARLLGPAGFFGSDREPLGRQRPWRLAPARRLCRHRRHACRIRSSHVDLGGFRPLGGARTFQDSIRSGQFRGARRFRCSGGPVGRGGAVGRGRPAGRVGRCGRRWAARCGARRVHIRRRTRQLARSGRRRRWAGERRVQGEGQIEVHPPGPAPPCPPFRRCPPARVCRSVGVLPVPGVRRGRSVRPRAWRSADPDTPPTGWGAGRHAWAGGGIGPVVDPEEGA